MSHHQLVIEYDGQLIDADGYLLHGPRHPDECIFPERTDDRRWYITCTDPEACEGWTDCFRLHLCPHGHSIVFDELSPDGPCPGLDDENCMGRNEQQYFHGELHTHRWGWGWTLPFQGCVVADLAQEPPDHWEKRPIGIHDLDVEWWGESTVYLDFVTPRSTAAAAAA